MMKKSLIKLSISSAIAFVGVLGFWIRMPAPMVERPMSQVALEDELGKAERLNNQAVELYQQGKYAEAIPLAEKALAIRKNLLGDNYPDVTESLNNLAALYISRGRYREAEPLLQKSLAITKDKLEDNHPDVAAIMNNLAFLYESQGKYTEAEPLYQESLAIWKEQLGDNHPDVATSMNNLAGLYYLQGRYTDAERLLKQSLAIRKEILGDHDLSVSDSLNNLGALYRSQGRYREAELRYEDSLAITRKKLGDNHPFVADTINNFGLLYYSQGRYTEAERLYQESLAIKREKLGYNHPLVADTLNNLAGLYYSQGRYREAEPLYQDSLVIRKEKLGDNHPHVAESLNNLAALYRLQGRYREAERLYEQSLNITKKSLGNNHNFVATILNNQAALYSSQERYTKKDAEALYQQSLAIRKEILPDNHPDVAESQNNLAALYESQERYTEAERLFKQSLAIRKEQLGENHPFVATSLNNLAALYESQERYTEAERLFKQSLAIRKEQLAENHPFVAESLNNLAALYYSQDNVTKAIEFLSQGLSVEEYNLSENLVAGDERQKQDYMRTISGTTNGAISLNLQSAPNNPEATRLALKTIFERKGRILDILTNSLQILRQRIEDSESQKLLTELFAIHTQYANLIFKKPEDFPSPEVYRQLIAEVQTKAKQLEDKLSRRSSEFRNLSQPITLEAIQEKIPADAALVELVRYRPFNPFNPKVPPNKGFGKPRYAAYILYQKGEPQVIDLGEAEGIDHVVKELRDKLVVSNPRTIKTLKKSARKLDKFVMEPVRQLLGETKTILLSPDATLNLIPFEALVDENNQYLVENYQISYLTSGRDLLRPNSNNKRQSALVIADPFYHSPVVAINRSVENISQLFATETFGRLEGTAQEAEAIQTTMGLSDNQIKTKQQATENALKQVKNPDFLHIATHGFFLSKPTSENPTNLDNPLFRSGLVFTGVEERQSGGDDGVFTADEATLLNLVGTQLVVLSACDTGIGDISTGEGIYGLRRAFVIAGSESQMISLWKVEDNATKDLMVAYYQGLKVGKGRRDALLEIQRNWLKEGEYEHPYYWASFIFSGDGTPIALGASQK
ncbi:CHAT domain-containing protein [Okeania sp. SIO2C2]|uniref:CHAT domain-containing tetratricopeptide repeat protein n=1 Tax=Okeania sp. SIO2C2 TaxID=2607787 RepID=UPI00257B3A91|nr:CHAT domain-containing protein [Okeania sp. SIO2C2]